MDDTVQMVVTLLGAGGVTTVITLLVNAAGKMRSGAVHRERIRNTNLITQRAKAIEEREKAEQKRDEAEAEKDAEAKLRREAEEHVAILQRQIILLGAVPLERKKETSK